MKRAGAFAAVMLAARAAAAQPQAPEGPTTRHEGDYEGVQPGQGHPPPDPGDRPAKSRPPPHHTLTWIGFTTKDDGSSELFFQAADPFTVAQRIDGKTLVVTLEGLPRQTRNTRRPLDTRFFDSAVLRVTARPVRAVRARKGKPGHGAGIEIRVSFKDARDLKEGLLRSETGKDRMFYAYLGFAASSAAPIKDAGGGQTGTSGTLENPE